MANINISLSYVNNRDFICGSICKEQQRAEKIAVLQQAITAGLESGDAGVLDMQVIKRKARIQAGLSES